MSVSHSHPQPLPLAGGERDLLRFWRGLVAVGWAVCGPYRVSPCPHCRKARSNPPFSAGFAKVTGCNLCNLAGGLIGWSDGSTLAVLHILQALDHAGFGGRLRNIVLDLFRLGFADFFVRLFLTFGHVNSNQSGMPCGDTRRIAAEARIKSCGRVLPMPYRGLAGSVSGLLCGMARGRRCFRFRLRRAGRP